MKKIIIGLLVIVAGIGASLFLKNKTALPVQNTTAAQTTRSVQTTAKTTQMTTQPTTQVTTQVTAQTTTQYNPNDDLLLLVNDRNPLPEEYKLNLTDTEFHQKIDKRAAGALAAMLKDCRAAGYKPLSCSGYRSFKKQTELYQTKLKALKRLGYSEKAAEEETKKWIASPGTSEHHTGLAMDIVDINYQILDEKQEKTGTQKWLMKHCTEYGFILRYPTDKKNITHINYEPWHYRYVGKENAKKIAASGLCLEEYLQKTNEN